MDDDYAERVKRRAYQIWLEEGRPEGREEIHWQMAHELVAIEDSQDSALKPVRRSSANPEIAADTVEPARPAANMGELPALTDEGEQIYPPDRAAEKDKGAVKPMPASKSAKSAGASAAPAPTAKPAPAKGAKPAAGKSTAAQPGSSANPRGKK